MKHVNVALEWWTCCRIGSAEIWKPIQRYAYVIWWQFDSRYVCVCLSLRIVLMVKSVGRQMSVGRCVCVCVVSLRAVHCIASRNIFVGKLQFINDGIWQRWPKKELVHPFHGYTCQGRIFWYCYFYPCIFFCCHTNFPVQIFGVFAAKPAVIYYFTSILMRWPFFINKYIFVIKTHFFSTFMLRIFIWYFQNFSTQKTFLTNNKILNDFFYFIFQFTFEYLTA